MNYAEINKQGKTYHLFGTHTHAYTTAEDIAVRFAQLNELKAFIDSKNIPSEELVMIGGFPTSTKNHFHQEHEDFLTVMDATEPMAVGDYPDSYAGPVNVYADDQYTEYLDYVCTQHPPNSQKFMEQAADAAGVSRISIGDPGICRITSRWLLSLCLPSSHSRTLIEEGADRFFFLSAHPESETHHKNKNHPQPVRTIIKSS